MFAALLVFSLVCSTLAEEEYHPHISPRFYNWQQLELLHPHYPIVGDQKYPQQYPEIDKDQELHQEAILQFQQDDPLDHYPYVKDPFDGFGPSSQENHEELVSDPLDQYPYVKDPYNGEGPSSHKKHEEHHSNPLDHYPYVKDPY
uniref:Putative secreted protein n=1 Tax=Panstrongylus lignarius TaxID=156445 RepID=A0A224Y0A0_9HEMI